MKALVTGATGFLGGALAKRLHAEGHQVIATGRNLARGAQLGLRFEGADLVETERMTALAADCEVVFHCAALTANWGSWADFERSNVLGTQSVVDACRAAGVSRLVHVSTPSVYHSGVDRFDVSEDSPLPPPVNAYAHTKALAEQIVRDSGVPAVILRPRGLFGPGDTTVFPRILRVLRSGRLRVVGSGDNVVDLTYIDNAVDGVVLAGTVGEGVEGRTYNLTNGEPVALWTLLERVAERLDLPPPQGHLSLSTARGLARGLEWVHRVLPLGEPLLTVYSVELLALSMTLDITRARAELGYRPKISIDEGMDRFLAGEAR